MLIAFCKACGAGEEGNARVICVVPVHYVYWIGENAMMKNGYPEPFAVTADFISLNGAQFFLGCLSIPTSLFLYVIFLCCDCIILYDILIMCVGDVVQCCTVFCRASPRLLLLCL